MKQVRRPRKVPISVSIPPDVLERLDRQVEAFAIYGHSRAAFIRLMLPGLLEILETRDLAAYEDLIRHPGRRFLRVVPPPAS